MNTSVCYKTSRQSLLCYSCDLFTRIIRNSCGRLCLWWGDLEGLYAPFGEVLHEYNAYWMLDTIPRLLFNGKELESESGMYYYSARYFKPPTFISRDPLFEKFPTMSSYAYCDNNSVKHTDPDGNDWANSSAVFDYKEGVFCAENKANSFSIVLDNNDFDLKLILSHEGGHLKYWAKNINTYLKWLNKNVPAGEIHNGHKYNDPS